MSSFLEILKERFRHISSLLQMDLARASLVLIQVLRTFSNSIAKNLHKLQICLRFYFFTKNSTFRLLNFYKPVVPVSKINFRRVVQSVKPLARLDSLP